MSKLSTENYKGVRDFYPEDQFVQNYIFSTWKKVVEKFGYVEYNASILESAELYKEKSGEEIVNEQTYTFTDRGDREVTLRPEMTPTVARMVAAREQELVFPLRWYSIPNLFRYEKPQRGRLREHWQLNVDLFGVSSIDAEIEIIQIARALMLAFGAKTEDFVIRVNSRKLMNDFYAHFNLSEEQTQKVSKIIDKKKKIPEETFVQSIREIVEKNPDEFITLLSSNEKFLDTVGEESDHTKELLQVIDTLTSLSVSNVVFDPTLMRGFDYYTGFVFEIFDTNPDNPRSLFGGGRYDDLLDIFGAKKVPAVGFGAGDVTIHDFLETHHLLPAYKPSAEVYICTLNQTFLEPVRSLAETLRSKNIHVSIDFSDKKVGDQIKTADKQHIPYVIVIGEDEVKTQTYTLKELATGNETKGNIEEIVTTLKHA